MFQLADAAAGGRLAIGRARPPAAREITLERCWGSPVFWLSLLFWSCRAVPDCGTASGALAACPDELDPPLPVPDSTGDPLDTAAETGEEPVVDEDGDGFTAGGGDCDDSDPMVHPAATEVCGNGVDDNCDGSPEGCGWARDIDVAKDGVLLSGWRADDLTGTSLAAGGDINGDGHADLLVSAPDASGGRGVVYIVSGPVVVDQRLADAPSRLFGSEVDSEVGWATDFIGDADGDGNDDVVVVARMPKKTSSDLYDPAVYVLHGPLVGDVQIEESGTPWDHEMEWDGAGTDVAGVGDVTGDGAPDLLVGAPTSDVWASHAGAAYVLSGPSDHGGALTDASVRILGNPAQRTASSRFGTSVARLGDLDGDGWPDFAVAAWGDADMEHSAGAAYIFRGPVSGDLVASDADALVLGPVGDGGAIGYEQDQIATVGDQDGDGHPDAAFLVPGTARDYDVRAGAICILGGDRLTGVVFANDGGATVYGALAYDGFGSAITGIGDQNMDGRGDMAVGAAGVDYRGESSGAVYVIYGPVVGADNVETIAEATVTGGATSWGLGITVASAELTDGGGVDLAIGAPGMTGDAPASGGVWVLPGGEGI